MYDDLQYETANGVAIITIDRPSVMNAFTQQTIVELNNALDDARTDTGVYAIVLTGAGGAFCAGADVTEMPNWTNEGKAAYAEFLRSVQDVVRTLRKMGTPSVAAVEGPAVGAGCDFALACDLHIVGPDAVLREGFVRVGLVPGDGGAWLLPRLIGEAKAKEYLLTGKDISAQDAVDLGLAVESSESPLQSARKLATELRDLPVRAVRNTKRLRPDVSFEEHCDRAVEYQWECVTDEEHDEALTALREGRDPEYDRDSA